VNTKNSDTGEILDIADIKNLDALKDLGRSNIADDIFYTLRELIISGKLKPGIMLPGEVQLSEFMGVGRSTLREALRALSAMGLITRTKRGTFVNNIININDILPFPEILERVQCKDIIEFRSMLETEIVALAAQRALAEDIKNLSQALATMKEAKDLHDLTKADTLFHLYLASASQNELLQKTYEMIRDALEKHIYEAFLNKPEIKFDAIYFHEKILDAVVKEDPTTARAIMKEHISHVAKSIGMKEKNN